MFDRGVQEQSTHAMMRFKAPKKGWIRNENLQSATGAEVLDNFFPTAEGCRLRKGSAKLATITHPAKQIMPYNAPTGVLFAATATDIYDVTAPADPDVAETAKMSNLASGDWSYTQFSTTAGDYLVAVNGDDYAILYDSTSLEPIGNQAVNELPYDTLTGEFTPGLTVTGGTSSATAVIFAVEPLASTTGVLKVGTVTGGPFQDNEALTDTATGAATEDGTIASGSTINITGVATTALSHVWSSHERLFFIEKATLNAWYLSTKAIGGAATKLPLGQIFKLGGSLLFGANWSLDAGAGQDDVCLFFTDQGEIAVYSGTDPASSSTWTLVGVYTIGKPLNKHSSFDNGGDVAIMTEDGIVPVSAAITKDRAALQSHAVTMPIEDAWQEAVFNRSADYPFSVTLWRSATMLIVGTPSIDGANEIAFVSNARTGAWCRFTGWDIRCSAVFNDKFYFGTATGTVLQGETTGSDLAGAYVGRWVPKLNDAGNGNYKFAIHARLTSRSNQSYTPTIQAFSDYNIGTYESVVSTTVATGAVWGAAVWGDDLWGDEGIKTTQLAWQAVAAEGIALAPVYQIGSNSTQAPIFELIVGDLVYEEGSPM